MSDFSGGGDKIVATVKKHPALLYGLGGVLVVYYLYKKYKGSSTNAVTTTASTFDPAAAAAAQTSQNANNAQNLATGAQNLQALALQDQTAAAMQQISGQTQTNYMTAQGQELNSVANVINTSMTPLLAFGATTINGIQKTNQVALQAAAVTAATNYNSLNNAIGSVGTAFGNQAVGAEKALNTANAGAAQTAQTIVQANAALTGSVLSLAGTAMMMA